MSDQITRPAHGTPYSGEIVVVRGQDPRVLALTFDSDLFTECGCEVAALAAILSDVQPSIAGVLSISWTDVTEYDSTATCTIMVEDPDRREEIAEEITTIVHAILSKPYGDGNTVKIAAIPLPVVLNTAQQTALAERLTNTPGIHRVVFALDFDTDPIAIMTALFSGAEPEPTTFVYLFGVPDEADKVAIGDAVAATLLQEFPERFSERVDA